MSQVNKQAEKIKLSTRNLNVFYGAKQVLKNVDLDIYEKQITALIGPSGCGKSTYLRVFNRMNDYIVNYKKEGSATIDNIDVYDKSIRVEALRKKIGMVFQKPTPFPKSIYENVIYGLKVSGVTKKSVLEEAVEKSLKQAALWNEVKDNLNESAMSLSGGQQQRLCIARTMATEPDVILMDEPTSALDPIATKKIEELMSELKKNYTILIVTHNMQQASRISDHTAFFYMGDLVEYGETKSFFTHPQMEQTQNYITGRFG